MVALLHTDTKEMINHNAGSQPKNQLRISAVVLSSPFFLVSVCECATINMFQMQYQLAQLSLLKIIHGCYERFLYMYTFWVGCQWVSFCGLFILFFTHLLLPSTLFAIFTGFA